MSVTSDPLDIRLAEEGTKAAAEINRAGKRARKKKPKKKDQEPPLPQF